MLMMIAFYGLLFFYVCCARRLALVRANVEGGVMGYVRATMMRDGVSWCERGHRRNEKREGQMLCARLSREWAESSVGAREKKCCL